MKALRKQGRKTISLHKETMKRGAHSHYRCLNAVEIYPEKTRIRKEIIVFHIVLKQNTQ